MKTVVPDYYPDFQCKAGRCRHTCCAGWEIDIDEETYEFYKRIGGDFGKRLSASVSTDGTPHFILQGEDERCPMLNADGLCDLIIEYGEEALCQICADHPRFINDYPDRTEIGLGLCCEAAGELILGKRDKVRLMILSDDGNAEPISERNRSIFELRNNLIGILQDRRFSTRERMRKVLAVCETEDNRSLKQLVDIFLRLERLDETWTDKLTGLDEADLQLLSNTDEHEQTILEQFAVYLAFRYSPCLGSEKAVLALSGTFRIFEALCAKKKRNSGTITLATAVENARLLSSEVEYSDENIECLFR
ncbi:MAG: flagellin lysine-N-methylase [Acutalibacteraceae bacterium]